MKPEKESSDDVRIDFCSAEFNRVDDLNDCAGNYRSFQSLDGIITAHERHQEELRLQKQPLDPSEDQPPTPRKSQMRKDDLEPLEPAAPLTVISEGRTLIIDPDAERAMACAKTLHGHRMPCALVVTGKVPPGTSTPSFDRIKLLRAEGVSVSGAFGGFSGKATIEGGEKPLAECLEGAATFDLVLDLQPVPSFTGGRLPLGYYAPGPSPAALEEVMAELPEMRGQFKKPHFVVFHKNRCFHGRSRALDCRRCMEVCPVHAIRSAGGKIFIDPYLCQGCGGCALVCPADAFRMVQPSQEELLNALRSSLEKRSPDGISPLSLIITDSALAAWDGPPERDERDSGRKVFFAVEEISYARLEVLLTALAYGATDVLVACGPQNTSAVREAVERQVQMARAILGGLGLGEERIRFLALSPGGTDLTKATLLTAPIGDRAIDGQTVRRISSPTPGGRALIYLAAQYLHVQSGVQKPWLPLPTGSPFGALAINSDACTLCMACAAACPSGALSTGGKTLALFFREFGCHQCGLCQETCPEGAIQLVPRLLLGHGATEGQTVLLETEPFRCLECGVPFAPPSMIGRMKEKLAGHWMYAGERQLRRLQMCRTCRTRDALTSGEEGSWNL